MTDEANLRASLAADIDKAGIAENLMREFAQVFEDYAAELMHDLRNGDPLDTAGTQLVLTRLHVMDDVKQMLITRYNDGVAARDAIKTLNEEDNGNAADT